MKKILIILTIACLPLTSTSQDLSTFLEAKEDANQLFQDYLEPAFLGFGYGINSGWYNTAKPHKLLGFDITAGVTVAKVPSSANFFTIQDGDHIRVDPDGPTDAQGNLLRKSPTVLGPNLPAEELPRLLFEDGDGNEFSISAPTGIGMDEVLPYNAVPSAIAQVGIGLVKNTEIKLRIVPKIEQDDYSFEMFGVGVMHDLKQWVPGFKQLPIDVSGFVGWNRMTAEYFLNAEDAANDPNIDLQTARFTTNGFTLQGLVSKKVAFITLFGGVGVASTGTTFELLGEYEVNSESNTLQDPIDFKYPASTSPRINVGFRMKLLILTIHADYAIQKYSTLTTGVGISIR